MLVMKLFFSLFFLSSLVSASEFVLISYQKNLDEAYFYKDILIKEYNVPEDFIEVELNEYDCKQVEKKARLHLCIDQSENLNIVFADLRFIKETLATFRNN